MDTNDDESNASPTDTRPRQDPLIGRDDGDEGLSESFQSTDTVRRRPEASYGTMESPFSPTAGSASQNNEGSTTSAHDRAHGRPVGQPVRSPQLGMERGRRTRRPPNVRRALSSNVQGPHHKFSVDDDIREVEADAASRAQGYSIGHRRRTLGPPPLARVPSSRDEAETESRPHTPSTAQEGADAADQADGPDDAVDSDEVVGHDIDDDDDDAALSEAESFTLKARQQAINETHPFGIRLWKPALYKKDRSVQTIAEGDIHSTPGGHVSKWLLFFNVAWTLVFGWWLALLAFLGAVVCFVFGATRSGREYGRVLWGLSGYLFYPFGKFVRLEQQEGYLDEDQGEGRSIIEYEQWQNGDLEHGRLFFGPERNRSIVGRSRRSIDSDAGDETESLLGPSRRSQDPNHKRRLFGRGQWNLGRVIFFLFFYFLITPSLFLVSAICWSLVFCIPMGKVTMLLFNHLRRHPLAVSFECHVNQSRDAAAPHSSIIVCTYRAVGLKYWKYTVDGTNVFLINLMALVMFIVIDYIVLKEMLGLDLFITSSAFLFFGGLASIIPLAYFIGQAVASISAQSSMGLGAAVNAFFSTIVEVFLYCVALRQGKGKLVEGSVVGSIFAGILFLPGLSMCCGAIKRKTQRFNSKSAGVTSTMLLFAVIGAFSPTLFYQIYGTHELHCEDCVRFGQGLGDGDGSLRDCRRCYYSQSPAAMDDRFYVEAVRPYCYLAAGMLFLSYVIGLWFTLRTHAAVIWSTDVDEKKHDDQAGLLARFSHVADSTGIDIRDSNLYKRILGQSLRQVGLQSVADEQSTRPVAPTGNGTVTPRMVPSKTIDQVDHSGVTLRSTVHIPGFSEAENNDLVQHVTEIAATAAAVAARDSRAHKQQKPSVAAGQRPPVLRTATFPDHDDGGDYSATPAPGGHGHDAPNWSRLKSAVILMGATVLYAVIAEILVNTVDVVLNGFAIDEKFLGITLFALVPNTTEFLNAISFAVNGNIALSMEIGSAYALQVCLLQIPALVLFSAVFPPDIPVRDLAAYTFSLLFPQWDMVTVILCVFMLSYMYGEGKSNYFKGSILLLSYLVVITGFYFSGRSSVYEGSAGISRFDTIGDDGRWTSAAFKTVGRATQGVAF